jgi:thioesterase domain-containing protein
MQTKSCRTSDGLPLTYYRWGGGGDVVLCVGAPGVGAQLWAPVAEELGRGHTVIALDYRGLPAGGRELADEELRWERFLGDISLVLGRESAAAAHFVGWGLGAKLALAYCRASPAAALSLTTFGMGDTALGAGGSDAYADAVVAVRQSLDAEPQSAGVVAALVKGVGGSPNLELLSSLPRAGEGAAAALRLIDLLEMESPMANIAFAAVDTPAGLRNYLRTHDEFLRAEVGARFGDLRLPVVAVEAAGDRLARLGAESRARLAAAPRLEIRTVSFASHFILLERPLAAARIIESAARRAGGGIAVN